MPTTKHIWPIATTCALFTLLAQSSVLSALADFPHADGLTARIVVALSALGLYVVVFRLLLMGYRYYAWAWFSPQLNIKGKWFHQVFDSKGECYRLGEVFVEQSFDSITIVGRNYIIENGNQKLVSIWHAENDAIWFNGLNLHFAYEVKTTLKDMQNKSGRCLLTLDGGRPPSELYGIFEDTCPSNEKGGVRFTREHVQPECLASPEDPEGDA